MSEKKRTISFHSIGLGLHRQFIFLVNLFSCGLVQRTRKHHRKRKMLKKLLFTKEGRVKLKTKFVGLLPGREFRESKKIQKFDFLVLDVFFFFFTEFETKQGCHVLLSQFSNQRKQILFMKKQMLLMKSNE